LPRRRPDPPPQVLLNLGGNAVKFIEHGGVHVGVTCGQVSDELIEIQFSVVHTGIGIAADKQDSIFEPFVQAEDFTTRRYGGTGSAWPSPPAQHVA
jgi:signal transduction histidine kinase